MKEPFVVVFTSLREIEWNEINGINLIEFNERSVMKWYERTLSVNETWVNGATKHELISLTSIHYTPWMNEEWIKKARRNEGNEIKSFQFTPNGEMKLIDLHAVMKANEFNEITFHEFNSIKGIEWNGLNWRKWTAASVMNVTKST